MMQQNIGTCKNCNNNRPLNSKGRCSDCQFVVNHGGKSKQEVYLERKLEREKDKSIKYTFKKRKPLRTSKKRLNRKVNHQIKEKNRENRLKQIKKDEETYEEVFNSKPNFCEETDQPLNDEFRDEDGNIIARWQYSHILTKAAYPEFRNDKRNFNRLSLEPHQQWEFGDRTKMKIYRKNKGIAEQLLKERNDEAKRGS